MDIRQDIIQHVKAFEALKNDIKLEEYKEQVKETLRNGGTIFVAGNGGSATDSAHLVGEIVGKFMIDRKGYPAVDLSANNSIECSLSICFIASFIKLISKVGLIIVSVFLSLSFKITSSKDSLIGVWLSGAIFGA